MAPDPHETSGSVSSSSSTIKLISESNSCSCSAQTYIKQINSLSSPMPQIPPTFQDEECVPNHLENVSVSSSMLFGDGNVFRDLTEIPYHDNNNSECSVHSSLRHIEPEVNYEQRLQRSYHGNSTPLGSISYRSLREQIYDRLTPQCKPKPKQTYICPQCKPKPKQTYILLCFSVSVGLLAVSLVSILSAQYIKSTLQVYQYENCTLCSQLTEDDNKLITYIRRLGELKYCCFESSRDPVYRLNKAMKKAFAPLFKAEEQRRTKINETNGTDAAIELTLEIGEVSEHFIQAELDLPMRKLTPMSPEIKVEEDRLVIQTPGRYFIQSQFSHNIKYMRQHLTRMQNIVGHDLHRANRNIPNAGRKQLIVSFYTAREYFPLTDYHVSNLAGIFRLEKNDRIFVGVSHRNTTQYSDSSRNRLSLIRLGN